MIEVRGLTRRFGSRTAVANLSFSVAAGEALGLVGPEGSGKSTVLRILAGCLPPTAGSATIAGHDVLSRSREPRRRVGYLPAPLALDGETRVEPYLDTMCRLHGVRGAARRERVARALETCGLADRRREVIGGLPPADRRRLGLARAIVHDPEVLLLDEPAELDQSLVSRLAAGRTVVVTGRDRSEVRVAGAVLELGGVHAAAVGALPPPGGGRQVVAVVRGDATDLVRHLRQLDGVVAVTVTDAGGGDDRLTVTSDREDLQDAVARVIVERGFGLKELR